MMEERLGRKVGLFLPTFLPLVPGLCDERSVPILLLRVVMGTDIARVTYRVDSKLETNSTTIEGVR